MFKITNSINEVIQIIYLEIDGEYAEYLRVGPSNWYRNYGNGWDADYLNEVLLDEAYTEYVRNEVDKSSY